MALHLNQTTSNHLPYYYYYFVWHVVCICRINGEHSRICWINGSVYLFIIGIGKKGGGNGRNLAVISSTLNCLRKFDFVIFSLSIGQYRLAKQANHVRMFVSNNLHSGSSCKSSSNEITSVHHKCVCLWRFTIEKKHFFSRKL